MTGLPNSLDTVLVMYYYKCMSNRTPTHRPRRLTVPERHQLRIARDTLRMNPAIAAVMGGPTPDEARKIVRRFDRRTR